MPYPPPPPGPDVGEFQAIGLLPAPQLPDVTGHGGDFLETDGVIPQWEPVGGAALPDQTGQSGKFLTTDGVNASWATVGGGGGGISTIGAVTTPTANAAIISGGGTTLQLAAADGSNAGILSTGVQAVLGEKHFVSGAAVTIFDIRDYGAVSSPDSTTGSTATVDCSPAFESAFAAWSQVTGQYPTFQPPPNVLGGIYVPTGNWWVSRPIMVPAGCRLYGDGINLSLICSGLGTPATPSQVQGFGGPVVYAGQPFTTGKPALSEPVLAAVPFGGGSARLMVVPDPSVLFATVFIGDTVASSYYGLFPSLPFSWDCWVFVTQAGTFGLTPLMGSKGPKNIYTNASTGADEPDEMFGLYCASNGTNLTFRAITTTASSGFDVTPPFAIPRRGTRNIIDSVTGGLTPNSWIYLSISFDLSNTYFYINGVHQGTVSSPGSMLRSPWEGMSIGNSGPDWNTAGDVASTNFKVFSPRMSKTARHTGSGSFTPPTASHTWDSSTLMLLNFDQGDPQHIAAVVGQTAIMAVNPLQFPTPDNPVGPVPFYVPIRPPSPCEYVVIDNIQIVCNRNTSGLRGFATDRGRFKSILVQYPTQYGIHVTDDFSFFSTFEDINVWLATGEGISFGGIARNIQTIACGIGVHMMGGEATICNDQPAYNNLMPFLLGPGTSGSALVRISQAASDQEAWVFARQLGNMVILSGLGTIISENNRFDSTQSPSAPVVYYGTGVNGHQAIHIGDVFQSRNDGGTPCSITKAKPFVGKIHLIDCAFTGPAVPISNINGWVGVMNASGSTNLDGLSVTGTARNNLTGRFTIEAGFTTGGPTFLNTEPDARYGVRITPLKWEGSGAAPPTAAFEIIGVVPATDGFTATCGADPTGDNVITFTYEMMGDPGGALIEVLNPAVPSTLANPLAGQNAAIQDWLAGISLVPVTGNVFGYNSTAVEQSCIESGSDATVNFWGTMLYSASRIALEYANGGYIGPFDAFVDIKGFMRCLQSPGTHNVAWGVVNGAGVIYIDTGKSPNDFDPFLTNPGIQGANIIVGQHYNTTRTLVDATPRNERFDPNPALVVVKEAKSGPQGTPQGAFFGDNYTIGVGSASATGGWASQIAQARYGSVTRYYHFAVEDKQLSYTPSISLGMINDLWVPWTHRADLDTIVVFAGTNDILGRTASAKTGAETWERILDITDGTQATAVWFPPSSLTGTLTLGGTLFTNTFNTNASTTINDLIAQIAGDPIKLQVLMVNNGNGTGQLYAVTRGVAGNSFAISCNLANGSGLVIGGEVRASGTLVGAIDGAIPLGYTTVVLCNLPPIGNSTLYTSGKNTERLSFNSSMATYVAGHGPTVVGADVDLALRDPADHTKILATNLVSTADIILNDTGHTVVYTLLNPLCP